MYNHQLDSFIITADAGSFHKAAEKLYITPSALIKQINLLEKNVGVRLFDRTPRGLVLTDGGKSLYKDAKKIIKLCEASKNRAINAMQKEERIRVGTSPITPPQFMANIYNKIHKQDDTIQFQFVPFDNTPENAAFILSHLGEDIDIVAGIFDATLLDYRQCNGYCIGELPLCLAVSLNHPLANKERLEMEDLKNETLMILSKGKMASADKLAGDFSKTNRIEYFDFYNTEIFNECESKGYLLMATSIWKDVHPLLKIIPVNWQYKMPYGILYSKEPSTKVQRLLDIIKNSEN